MLFRIRSLFLRGFVFALLLALAAACGDEKAQDFEVELFDGSPFRLSKQFEREVVVINFWYPSCPPCREEMPEFQLAWEELEDKPVRFLGLFVPLGFDTEHSAREFVADLGLTFDFATDRRKTTASAYGVEFYPTTLFIDQGGIVAETYVSMLDAERITGIVEDLIKE